MAELIMRHYIVKDHDCEPCRETGETLRNLGSQMARRLAPLGVELKLQEAEMAEATEENCSEPTRSPSAVPRARWRKSPSRIFWDSRSATTA